VTDQTLLESIVFELGKLQFLEKLLGGYGLGGPVGWWRGPDRGYVSVSVIAGQGFGWI